MERFSGAIIQSFTVYFDVAIDVQYGIVGQGIPVQLVPLSWYRVRMDLSPRKSRTKYISTNCRVPFDAKTCFGLIHFMIDLDLQNRQLGVIHACQLQTSPIGIYSSTHRWYIFDTINSGGARNTNICMRV